MSAYWFLVTRTFKNALLKRLRRLKNIRYLISTVIFVGYFSLVCGGGLAASFADDGKSQGPGALPVTSLSFVVGLMILSFCSTWIWPERNQLIFAPAEIQFLFPAPVTRASLLRFKMVKAQLPLLFTSLIATWAASRRPGTHWWAALGGTWIAFNAAFLHRTGAALVLVPSTARARHRLPLWVGRALVVALLGSLVVSYRPLDISDPDNLAAGIVAWSQRSPACWALEPFRLLLRPAIAPDLASFASALPPALAILLLLYFWVIKADASFEEASIASSTRLFARIAAIRRTGRLVDERTKADPAPIKLSWTGRPIWAIAWKNLLLFTRAPIWRVVLLLAALAGSVAAFTVWGEPHVDRELGQSGVIAISGASLLAFFAFFLTLMGPDMFRFDLRTSLGTPDLVKALPLSGRQILVGEILAPVSVLVALQAYMLFLASLFARYLTTENVPESMRPDLPPLTLPLAWVSAVLALAPFDLLLFVVANGTAVLFPAWVPVGANVNRVGAEAGGMRMIVAIVRMIVLGAGFLPAAMVGTIVGVVGWIWLGPFALPLASLAGGGVVFAEAAVLIYFLGGVLDRFDPAVELR